MWNVGQMALRSQPSRHQYLLRPVLHWASNLPHSEIKILIPELKIDGGKLQNESVQEPKIFFNVTKVNISVGLTCNL